MTDRIITIISVLVAVASFSLWASSKHTSHNSAGHNSHVEGGVVPVEGGQSAFAALIEIVSMHESDSSTDWSVVDIDGLRSHLVDMNHLMLNTGATSTVGADQITYEIQGGDDSIGAIHRMVPAHAHFIEQSREWNIDSQLTTNGATLTIHTGDTATLSKLDALGFYGFMSLDSHHQAHHYQMSLGKSH